jgi:hypothetical protein
MNKLNFLKNFYRTKRNFCGMYFNFFNIYTQIYFKKIVLENDIYNYIIRNNNLLIYFYHILYNKKIYLSIILS